MNCLNLLPDTGFKSYALYIEAQQNILVYLISCDIPVQRPIAWNSCLEYLRSIVLPHPQLPEGVINFRNYLVKFFV